MIKLTLIAENPLIYKSAEFPDTRVAAMGISVGGSDNPERIGTSCVLLLRWEQKRDAFQHLFQLKFRYSFMRTQVLM